MGTPTKMICETPWIVSESYSRHRSGPAEAFRGSGPLVVLIPGPDQAPQGRYRLPARADSAASRGGEIGGDGERACHHRWPAAWPVHASRSDRKTAPAAA